MIRWCLAAVALGSAALSTLALGTLALGAGGLSAQSASPRAKPGKAPLARPATTAATSSTLAGVYTDSQALRGQELYLGFCKQCHTAESHTGAVFRNWWSGRRLGDLFSFVSTRMPKNEPASLDPQHYADLVAYLLKMNAMPPGPTELGSDIAALQKITIVTPPATARKRKKS